MNKKSYDLIFPVLLILADFITILLSLLFSFWLRFDSPLTALFPVTKGTPPLSLYFYSSVFIGLAFLLALANSGAYKSSRPRALSDLIILTFKSISLGLLIVLAFSFFYRSATFSRLTLILMWLSSVASVSLEKALFSKLEKRLHRRGWGVRKAIVVATPAGAQDLVRRVETRPEFGYRVVGTVVPEHTHLTSGNYLGEISDLPEIITSHRAEVVLMSLPIQYHRLMLETAIKCDDLKVEFQIAPDLLELLTLKAKIVSLDGTPFISLGKTPLEGWNGVLKRTFDVGFSALGLLIFSPLFLLLAIMVKLDSSGPVLFLQERLGRDGRKFNMLKFRSMKTDAEAQSGPVRAIPEDQRRTRIGKFLRKTSLDELPQFWNVLKGEMSLVGPRPERGVFVDKFKEDLPRYFVRHRVKSGMTGWAQVNGLRGNTSIEERTKYDLYYVENWSLSLDVKIIIMTLRHLFNQRNAY